MYREECFWHNCYDNKGVMTHQCQMAEPWTCPCKMNCELFISNGYAHFIVYSKQIENMERRRTQMSFEF